MADEELVILDEETEVVESTDDLLKEIEDSLEFSEDEEIKLMEEDMLNLLEEVNEEDNEKGDETSIPTTELIGEELDFDEKTFEDELDLELVEPVTQELRLEAVEETPVKEETDKKELDVVKEEPLQLFEEDDAVSPKIALGRKEDKVGAPLENKPQVEKGASLIHSILASLLAKTMSDSDFESLCKLKQFRPASIVKRGDDVGLDKRIILYGVVTKDMNVPYEKEYGTYEEQGLGVIEELVNRLQAHQPALSDEEYTDFCTFLGVQPKAIDDRAKSLWLNRELVLLGVLKLKIKGV